MLSKPPDMKVPIVILFIMMMLALDFVSTRNTSDMAALLVGAMKDKAAICTPTDAKAGFKFEYWKFQQHRFLG